MIHFDDKRAVGFLKQQDLDQTLTRGLAAQRALGNGTGAGAEWLGWRNLVSEPNDALLEQIQRVADRLRHEADIIVVVGIGGSYLGARALLRARTPYFRQAVGTAHDDAESLFEKNTPSSYPEILFAGHHMSGAYMTDLLDYLNGKSVYLIVISKSGTTLEPAIAFRFLRQWLKSHFEDVHKRIVVITDSKKGALFSLASSSGYERFVIPDDVGGRFSVLTPVGLLPAACGGIDIRSVFYGAVAEFNDLNNLEENDSHRYACLRHTLLKTGYETEVLAHFEPRLDYFASWFQQLFGESEGKNHGGIFPVVAAYSTDLHSLGQYLQDGRRTLFETFLLIDPSHGAEIPSDSENRDGLNYLAGRSLDVINAKAYEGTSRAHETGGVPNMTLRMDSLSEENLGRYIYFFEHAASIGGYLAGVNPFDQPGVEAYKKEMLVALGRDAA